MIRCSNGVEQKLFTPGVQAVLRPLRSVHERKGEGVEVLRRNKPWPRGAKHVVAPFEDAMVRKRRPGPYAMPFR